MGLTDPPSASKLRGRIKLLSIIGWIIILLTWILVLYNFTSLPEKIPMHFDISGKPDRYGKRYTILILPVIATILTAWLSGLGYSIRILRVRVNGDSGNTSLLMQSLSAVIALIFLEICWKTIEVAKGKTGTLGAWFLPMVIILILAPIIWYFIRSGDFKRNEK